MKRRSILAAAVATPVLLGLKLDPAQAATPVAAPALPSLTLYDARLPAAERAAWYLHRRGAHTRPTGGEIVGLLLRERLFAGEGPIMGITGHSEYLLARDIARLAGRQVSPLLRLGHAPEWLAGPELDGWQPLFASLLANAAQQQTSSTAFAWIAV